MTSVLQGEAGDDQLEFLDGQGTLYGGAGDDMIRIAPHTQHQLTKSTVTAYGGNDSFTFFNTTAWSDTTPTSLYGGAGDDSFLMAGLYSRDWVYGGAGKLTAHVGNGISGLNIQGGDTGDLIVVSATRQPANLTLSLAAGDDTVSARSPDAIFSGVTTLGDGDDWLAGLVSGAVFAGTGRDTVVGAGSTGTIDLGAGDDLLRVSYEGEGHLVNDLTVTTGIGADVVEFRLSATGQAVITDFDPAHDRLYLVGVTAMGDIAQVSQRPRGVMLVDHQMTILLQGLVVADLTDAVFGPL